MTSRPTTCVDHIYANETSLLSPLLTARFFLLFFEILPQAMRSEQISNKTDQEKINDEGNRRNDDEEASPSSTIVVDSLETKGEQIGVNLEWLTIPPSDTTGGIYKLSTVVICLLFHVRLNCLFFITSSWGS